LKKSNNMPNAKPKSARKIAAMVLNKFDPIKNYASDILNQLIHQTEEKQRATDLVFGTIRNLNAIDMIIEISADCPVERISAQLLNIIRIGAYELIYSPKTVEYAIVNEAVENAKAIAGKKQTNFVNAVLRQITRNIQNRQTLLSQAERTKILPHNTETGCEFKTQILPDIKINYVDYFSLAFSLPKWLVKQWLEELGREKTAQVCFAANRRPAIYIRINKIKTSAEKLAQTFKQAEIEFDTIDDTIIKIRHSKAISSLPGFNEGLFSIQDVTAAKAVNALKPQPNWKILDLCSAPGGKTTQVVELTNDKADIFATDIDDKRLEKVKENTKRLGVKNVTIVPYKNLNDTTQRQGPFDCVILDVPCSNTGVLAKRPEVRLKITPRAIQAINKIQTDLLDYAASIIKPNGRILYSTCSIQKCENSDLIHQFLTQNDTFKLQHEALTLPDTQHVDCDGGYVAILSKT